MPISSLVSKPASAIFLFKASTNSDAKFYKVDRDGSIDVAKELNIFGIPSFVVYQDGKEIGRLVNKDRKTKEEVENFLNSLK